MLKKIKLQNSLVLFSGLIIILIGLFIMFFDYFKEKKANAFQTMNIKLYENTTPENIEKEDIEEPKENTENEIIDKPSENNNGIENTNGYIAILEIPKINLKKGLVDIKSKYNSIDYNVTIIEGSTMPDEDNSNLILAAHSGVCSICFFDSLYKLSIGDLAYVDYKNIKYTYEIVNIYNVPKDGTVEIYRNFEKKGLTLITCTRGSDTEQTVYILDVIKEQ